MTRYFYLILLSFSIIGSLAAQDNRKSEDFETLYSHWPDMLDNVRDNNKMSKEEFGTFYRFSEKSIDSVETIFVHKINTKEINLSNLESSRNRFQGVVNKLYARFKRIEQEYPQSVQLVRDYKPPYMSSGNCDTVGCNNIDFEAGNLSGWNAYYAVNHSSTTAFNIIDITGGPAGAVTRAANDTLTSNAHYHYGELPPLSRPDYQVYITSGSRGDALVPSVPVVSPFGGNYSVMLGDSTQINQGCAILSQTFKVLPSNANLTYQYAVFLANPGHTYYQQPFFSVKVLDQAGDTIGFCGEYNVVSGHGTSNFDSVTYNYSKIYEDTNFSESYTVFYRKWTIVNVPLKKYVGQCVTLVFQIVDCALGGHFGYAYVDASCSPLSIISSSNVLCGQKSITLTGPVGESGYQWTGPKNGIISNDTLQQIYADSAGTYTLVVTPFTGATCNDTMTISIGKQSGPPPVPLFTADTVCQGSSTYFTNISSPISGAQFYWDFYNLGTYEDSTVNALWKYNNAGTYTVKLHEVFNGCGVDTLINVKVDSNAIASFLFDTICANQTMSFTNISTGAIRYLWNFGNPSSGINDTTSNPNPSHTYDSAGIFTVSLISKNPDGCNDTNVQKVTVLALPKLLISGSDTLCSGNTVTLIAGGATSYTWSTGQTSDTIKVKPTSNTTYTLTGTNGRCSADTSITIKVKPVLPATISDSGFMCKGNIEILTATGGGTYLWSTGATTSSITVPLNSKTDSAYTVLIVNGNGCIELGKSIVVDSITFLAVCCNDTVYLGNDTMLHANGSSNYFWTPSTFLSCDNCPNPIVTPTTTTTYTVTGTDSNGCPYSETVRIVVEIPCDSFFVPNVFTPTQGPINNVFLVNAKYMSAYTIDIYNRWGQKMFTSNSPTNPWNGNVPDGSPAPDGVYYYIIRSTCADGHTFDHHGFVQLIR
jgi:gliding motility-associated-like protein